MKNDKENKKTTTDQIRVIKYFDGEKIVKVYSSTYAMKRSK